ncbi:adenylate cyclase [Methylomagnum ishizawai]|uniref:Adenylate cyclase n=1 Tax=Methylomagnum ishizawai TaxID=1760988 RepID=A0A1Y6D0R9_9GAMM|nr:CHASE2 domain-containing protein [Methylomagnum ishizawai]SMF93575.1 adenylate cyclase [Methylomagnum ishizawai]
MTGRERRTRPKFQLGWLPLLTALGGALFSLSPLRGPLEEGIGLGLLYALRGPASPPGEVAILGIDHESAQRLQAPDDPHNWPRHLHANILRNAQRGQAELLAFNIFFANASADPGADRTMAEAMRDLGRTVLTDYVKPRQLRSGLYVESLVEPTPELADAALATAPFLLPRDTLSASSAFLTFFGDEERRATLPTLLMLAYIQRTHCAELGAWLGSADPELARIAAQAPPCQTRPKEFEPTLRLLIEQFRARPELGTDLEQALLNSRFPAATRRLLRSWAGVLAGGEVRYFNHYGPSHSFPILSYQDWVGDPPESTLATLAGKIVLVGYLEDFQPESTEGLFYTPFSAISSVELAATALANLLEDKWVRPAFSPVGEGLWLLLWGGVLGLCAMRRSAAQGFALILGLGGLYLAAASTLFGLRGDWLPLVAPLGLQLPIALLTWGWLNYVRRAERERTMQSVIHRFIPVDVFSQLSRHEDSATLPNYGRMAQGICLATDAGRYTALAETLEPMALARLMNAYYAALFEPVTRHGGWVSDVVGDAMLAIWIARDDDPGAVEARANALAAASEIRRAVRRFEKNHELVFPVRLGIHYGELRIGYVGTAERGEIRAVGDTVNIAARLEGLNKLLGTHSLVSERTLEDLPDAGTRSLGAFLLAGKSKPISVAELITDPESGPCPELRQRFADALALFNEDRWQEAHAAFTLLNLQFPDDGPTRFYYKTCQGYLAEPPQASDTPGIAVEKPPPAELFNQKK